MIIDVLNDAGIGVHADVSGDDITMCAAVPLPTALETRTAANPGCVDGGFFQGGIGTPGNFLEIDVDTTNAASPALPPAPGERAAEMSAPMLSLRVQSPEE